MLGGIFLPGMRILFPYKSGSRIAHLAQISRDRSLEDAFAAKIFSL
jgi:hypothetical protein